MLPETREETQQILDVLLQVEDEVAKYAAASRPVYLCVIIEVLQTRDKIGLYAMLAAKRYVLRWFTSNYPGCIVAPFHRFIDYMTDEILLKCRLIWLDFMIYELEDHLKSFNSTGD